MSEQPTASASPGGGKRILGLPRRQFIIVVGAGLVAGLAWYWYKTRKSAASGTSTAGGGTGTDVSGQLSTLQSEIQALQQENAGANVGSGSSGGGGSWGGGGWSGGSGGDSGSGDSGSSTSGDSTGSAATSGGSTSTSGSTSGATSSGGSASGSSGTSGGSSSGGSSSGSSGGGAAPAPSNGRVVTNGGGTAVLAWNGNGAAYWTVHITGPGPLNGRTNRVTGPQATYFGVQKGHNYEVRITPYTANGTPGPVGGIDFKAN